MNWTKERLGSICKREGGLIQTGPFGSQLHQSDYIEDGIPVIMPQDIVNGRVDYQKVAKVSEEVANRLSRHKLKPRAIVMPRRGAINKRAFISEDEAGYMCGSGCVKIELSEQILNSRFLFYFLDQPRVVSWIEQHAVGTTMLNLNTSIIENIPIEYPSMAEQQRIADTLSAYDDLMENNRRRIALLEDAARQLYQEWFVRLRFPGAEHTRIVDGVPEGWRKGKIEDFYNTSSGGTPSRKRPEYFEGNIPWVKTGELQNAFILDTEEKITEEAISASSAKIFPAFSVLVAMYGATVGQAGIISIPSATNQACCALISYHDPLDYLYAFLFVLDNKDRLISLSAGAAQNNISQQIIRDFPMVMPKRELMNIFNDHSEQFLAQILNLQQQNEKLKAARDLLLPHLMNGG